MARVGRAVVWRSSRSSTSNRASPKSRTRRFGSFSRHRCSSSADARWRRGRQRVPVRFASQNGDDGVRDCVARERDVPGEHLVEHAPECPDVGPLVDGLAARLLRTHVGGGAEDRPALCRAGHRRRYASRSDRRASSPAALARPKSRTFTAPSGVISILAGFRSRWTMPFSCAMSRASAICRAMSTRQRGHGPCPRSRSASVRPLDQLASTSSSTRQDRRRALRGRGWRRCCG